MNCRNCGAPLRPDRARAHLVCDYCSSRVIPPALGDDGVQIVGATAHPCPICNTLLADGRIENRPLRYCQTCRGMLIDVPEFLPLIERLRSLLDRPAEHLTPREEADDRTIDCPVCRRAMLNYVYGGGGNVHLDSCRWCEVIWLDQRELRRIVVAPDPRPVYSKHEAHDDSDTDADEQTIRSFFGD